MCVCQATKRTARALQMLNTHTRLQLQTNKGTIKIFSICHSAKRESTQVDDNDLYLFMRFYTYTGACTPLCVTYTRVYVYGWLCVCSENAATFKSGAIYYLLQY